MKIMRPFVVLLSAYVAFAEHPPTRGELDQLSFWQILTGGYERNLRPAKKALVVVDPQWCKFLFEGREVEAVGWLRFINQVLLRFPWNNVYFTAENKPWEHISFTENLENMSAGEEHELTYNKENGAICEENVKADMRASIFTDSCTDPDKKIKVNQFVTSNQSACVARQWPGIEATAFLPYMWIPPDAAVLKRSTRAHVENINIFENSFTKAIHDQGDVEIEPRVKKTIQDVPAERWAYLAQAAELFFVGSDIFLIDRAAREARRLGFKTVVLMDGIQRRYEDQAEIFRLRKSMHENDVQTPQYISDFDSLGELVFQNYREIYERLMESAYDGFSFEFGAIPDEFTSIGDGLYPITWIVVGIMIGGVLIGICVTVYYMRRVNPKIAEEQREEGIRRTRSGE